MIRIQALAPVRSETSPLSPPQQRFAALPARWRTMRDVPMPRVPMPHVTMPDVPMRDATMRDVPMPMLQIDAAPNALPIPISDISTALHAVLRMRDTFTTSGSRSGAPSSSRGRSCGPMPRW